MQTNFNNRLKDVGDWARMPYIFQLGEDFANLREVITYITSPDHAQGWNTDFNTFLTECTPKHFMRPNTADTTPGGNDAINCYWQYNIDDDIIHPLTALNEQCTSGMGRVYSETIDNRQQILWMTCGVPEFSNLGDFYADAVDKDVADLMNTGSSKYLEKIGYLMGQGIKFAFLFPFIPLIFLNSVANALSKSSVGRYYDLNTKGTMLLYYRFVNSIVAHLAVNMGLFPNGDGKTNNGTVGNQTYLSALTSDSFGEPNKEAIPSIFRGVSRQDKQGREKNVTNPGINIFQMLRVRDYRAKPGLTPFRDPDDYLAAGQKTDDEGMFDGICAAVSEIISGADKFVGFRIEKSTDSSESLSNTTGESSIAQTLNSTSAASREARFSVQDLETGIAPVDWITNIIGSVAKGLVNSVSVTAASAGSIFLGDAFVDIPEVWKGSSFSKSYSFSMQLRSPYGDPISIMQSIYIPLAMLLAMALPRSAGKNSYTSPFLIRAYSKGMFAIPLGIIESINIQRGAAEHGWSTGMLPTCVHVSFTIRDLSPTMHMAMADGAEFMKILGQNSNFQEYLLTLSGMGLNERLLMIPQIIRKFRTSMQILRSTYMNPFYWAQVAGNSSVGTILSAVAPFSGLGNK